MVDGLSSPGLIHALKGITMTTILTFPTNTPRPAKLEIIGDQDIVLIDGIMPRELAADIVALVQAYNAGAKPLAVQHD